MASPIPKPAAKRQRRNRSTSATTLPTPEAFTIPELPEGYDKRTVRWWASVKRSPMQGEYTDSDWEGLLAVAACLNTWWLGGDPKSLAEFRNQCREYGLTPMARRSLQWEIKRAEGITPAATAGPRRSSRSTLAVLSGGKG